MAELLFIATTIFVAYVVFEVTGKKNKPASKPTTLEPSPAPGPTASTDKPETSNTETTASSVSTPTPTPVAKKKSPPTAKSSASKQAVNTVKNPKTGAVDKLPSSYAFAKRWIKEALVEEGLLDKIYKNNEMDANTSEKVRNALQQLKAMDKYQ